MFTPLDDGSGETAVLVYTSVNTQGDLPPFNG